MKKITSFLAVVLWVSLLSACELICQAGTGTCGMSSEERRKLLHPKAYGEYFVKPGVSQNQWRLDWVACGGRPNGQFSSDAASSTTAKESLAAWHQARKNLDACMNAKGYDQLKGYGHN